MNPINLICKKINLSTTETLILDSVKKFTRNELKKNIINHPYGNNTREIYKSLGDLGVLGPTIKTGNCLGLSYKMYGLIAKEIEYIDSGYRSLYSVQSSLVMNPINKYGSKYAIDKYIPNWQQVNISGVLG